MTNNEIEQWVCLYISREEADRQIAEICASLRTVDPHSAVEDSLLTHLRAVREVRSWGAG